jgi:hypothetical protein
MNAWGFRQPLYIELYDRTRTEPGTLFRAFFTEAKKSKNQWYLIFSGDDIPERTHMLIPDEEYGFSEPYAIASLSAYLGKKPDLHRAVNVIRKFVQQNYKGTVPEDVYSILKEANELLTAQLRKEVSIIKRESK